MVEQLKQVPLNERWAERLNLDIKGPGKKKALRVIRSKAEEYGRRGVYGNHWCLVVASKAFSAEIRVVAPSGHLDAAVEWDKHREERGKKWRVVERPG